MIMGKEFLPVKLNFLQPEPGLVQIRDRMRYASAYLGISDFKLFQFIRGNGNISEMDTGKIIEQIFDFGSPEKAQGHFLDAQKTARAVIRESYLTFGLPPDRFSQKNEVEIPDPQLWRMLLYLNNKPSVLLPEGSSSDVSFEQLRELFLVDIALRLDRQAGKETPYDNISDLQLQFNRCLFTGPAGSTEVYDKFLTLDNENAVISVSDNPTPGSVKSQEKMRLVRSGGRDIPVLYNFNKKSAARQITKILTDAINCQQESFDPFGIDSNGQPFLQDRQRFMFVTQEAEDIPLIHSQILKCANFDDVQERPISRDNGQNPTVANRYIVNYRGIPMEVIYYTLRGYKNAELHIGHKGPDGLFTGSSHHLYAIRRSKVILPYFFPYEVYGLRNQTRDGYKEELMDFARKQSEKVADSLRLT